MSSFSKTSVYACPHGKVRVAFSKVSTLESVFKNKLFQALKTAMSFRGKAKPQPNVSVFVKTLLSCEHPLSLFNSEILPKCSLAHDTFAFSFYRDFVCNSQNKSEIV